MTYREVDNTADKALEVKASSLVSLFEQAGYGMFDLMSESYRSPSMDVPHSAETVWIGEAFDTETLLVLWLEDLLEKAARLRMYPFSVSVVEVITGPSVTNCEHSIRARVVFSDWRAPEGAQIKAVTFHDLAVVHEEGQWTVTITFDV